MDYTNSPLVSLTRLSAMHSGQRQFPISRITPHIYVGQVSIRDMGNFFASPDHQVSCNYCISKDGEIGLIVEEKNRSWCTNSPDNDGKGIAIECASDRTQPYALLPSVYEALVRLCADVCQRNGKKKLLWISDKTKALSYHLAQDEMLLTVHMWFRDTDCPGQWLMQRMGDLAERVTALLVADGGTTGEVAEDNNVPGKQDDPEVSAEHADDGPETVAPPADSVTHKDEAPVQPNKTGIQAKNLARCTNVEIVNTVGPLFTKDQRETGILASVSMAQFILESGYARTDLAQNANNCFGMKAVISGNTWNGTVWDGESKYRKSTGEYRDDGTPFTIVEDFRAYPCIEDSISDHSAYLLGAMNGDVLRYAGLAGCTDYRKAAQIIKAGGYATAPDYVDALCQIIEMWGLTQWDTKQEEYQPQEQPKQDEQLVGGNTTVTLSLEDWDALMNALNIASQILDKYESE